MKNRRKLRNLVLDPKYQFKFVFLAAGSALLVSFVNAVVFYTYIKENYAILVDLSPMTDEAKAQLYAELRQIILFLGAGSLLFVLAVAGMALYFSHRSAGPLFQFKRVFDQIRKGQVESRIHLRPRDDFHEVAKSFNEMMDSLTKSE